MPVTGNPVNAFAKVFSFRVLWRVLGLLGLVLLLSQADLVAQEAAAGRTFYVSERGDNAADGLSPETPWYSLARVTRDGLEPGDVVLLERGSIFRETLYIESAGQPDKPITFAAYGEGDRPIISGANTLTDWQVFEGEPERMGLYRQLEGGGDEQPFGRLRSNAESPRKGQIVPNTQAIEVDTLNIWLKQVGAVEGQVWAELWRLDGSPSEMLGRSASINAADLSADYQDVSFEFGGLELPPEDFAILITGNYVPDGENYLVLDTRYIEGERFRFPLLWENLAGGAWTLRRDTQLRYEVTGKPSGVRFNKRVYAADAWAAPRRLWAGDRELQRRSDPYNLKQGQYAYQFGRTFVRLEDDASPQDQQITASQRRFALFAREGHDHITLKDLVFERSNGFSKNDAVVVAKNSSDHWTLDNVLVRYGAANGLFGERSVETGTGIGSHLLVKNSESYGHSFRGAVAAGHSQVEQVFDNFYSHDNWGDGLLINSREGTVKNSRFEHNGGEGGEPKHGIYIYSFAEGSENWQIFDTLFKENRDSGIRVAGKNNHIYNNRFEANPFGMFVVDIDGVNEGHLIENNIITDTGENKFGLELEGAQDIVVRGNTFENAPGIVIANGRVQANRDIRLENNTYEGGGDPFVIGCEEPGKGREDLSSGERLNCY